VVPHPGEIHVGVVPHPGEIHISRNLGSGAPNGIRRCYIPADRPTGGRFDREVQGECLPQDFPNNCTCWGLKIRTSFGRGLVQVGFCMVQTPTSASPRPNDVRILRPQHVQLFGGFCGGHSTRSSRSPGM
jgi:hypothetical protein